MPLLHSVRSASDLTPQVFADIVVKMGLCPGAVLVVQAAFRLVERATMATICLRKPLLHCICLLSLCLDPAGSAGV